MLLSRGQPVTMIRHSGVVFEGEQGRKYAQAVARIVESVQTGLEEVGSDAGDTVSGPAISWRALGGASRLNTGRGALHAHTHETPRAYDLARYVPLRLRASRGANHPRSADGRYLLAVLHDPAV